MSLFLQFSHFSDFLAIQLEQPELADFVLVFTHKRIICESKKYKVTHAKIREILATIPHVGDTDEILIICQELDPKIPRQMETAQYYEPVREYLLTKKHFSPEIMAYLPRLRFWSVGKQFDETAVKGLLLQRLGTWVPEDELEQLLSDLLIQKVYKPSAESGEYSKAAFEQDIEAYKRRLIEKDDRRAKERTAEAETRHLLDELSQSTSSRLLSDGRLSALASQPRYHWFALEFLQTEEDVSLEQWDRLWQATFGSYYARQVLTILKAKITDAASARYVLSFVHRNADQIRYRLFDEFRYKRAADVLMRVVEAAPDTEEQAASLLMQFYTEAGSTTFYAVHRPAVTDDWVQNEIAECLAKLYLTSNNPTVRQRIVGFICAAYDLVDARVFRHDEGSHPFFTVLLAHVSGNEKGVEELGHEIVRHYDRLLDAYKVRPSSFDGWDLCGGGGSNLGGEFTFSDCPFVTSLMAPAITSLGDDARWTFVSKHTTRTADEVSRARPDFYNRAAIPTLLSEFSGGPHAQEALDILSAHIRMRRGIPFKADLIYQAACRLSLPPEKKWQLLKIGLDEYGYPINPPMDRMLQELFPERDIPAIATFEEMLDSPDYMRRQSRFEVTVDQSLANLLANQATFSDGVRLLKKYLASDYFQIDLDSFHASDLKDNLFSVLSKDPDQGIALLNSLVGAHPTANEQTLFGAIVQDAKGPIITIIYAQTIAPLLTRFKTAQALSQVLSQPNARESVVWFGQALADSNCIAEAVRIAEFFVTDRFPEPNGELDEGIINGITDHGIETPRGVVPWLLMHTCNVHGRPYLDRVFSLVDKLCHDASVYVRGQAVLGLEALVSIRQCRVPESGEWYMAYELTSSIEALAFDMLNNADNQYPTVLHRLAGVFNKIRTVSDTQAIEVISRFEQLDDDEFVDDLAAYIIFMAEFREHAYDQWPAERPGIAPFNPEPLRQKVTELLTAGSPRVRRALAWHICTLPEHASDEDFDKLFTICCRYLDYLTANYDHPTFETVYRFIEEYLDREFHRCYSLWRRCLEAERPAIQDKAQQKTDTDYTWWPYFYNDTVLTKVAEEKGGAQFVSDLLFLLEYPLEAAIAHDLDPVVDMLVTLKEPRAEIEHAFSCLIERNPKYLIQFDRWRATS